MRDIPEEIKEIPATVLTIYEKYFKRNAGSKLIKLPFSTRISIENFFKRKTERLSLRIFDEAVEKCVLLIAPAMQVYFRLKHRPKDLTTVMVYAEPFEIVDAF